MTTDIERLAKEARFAWLRSQWRWHKRRLSGPDGAWHKRQSRFYLKESHKVFTFSEIVTRALIRNSGALADNVTSNNALFKRLIELSPMPGN